VIWTILTCEYPPDCGGVGDYTAQVGAALAAAGDDVAVFCPPREASGASASGSSVTSSGPRVITLPDHYGSKSRAALDDWLRGRSSTVLVQYVPSAFGMRGANLPFCRWLAERSRAGADVRVMFHEPYYEFTLDPLQQNALAVVQRWMARYLLQASTQTYLSTDAWRRYLEPYKGDRRWAAITLSIPSAIPRCDKLLDAAELRRQLLTSPGGRLVGHFGTYGSHIAPALRSALLTLLAEDPSLSAICAGGGSDVFVRSLMEEEPSLAARLHGTGRASAAETAVTLSACDLLLQPYIDGVTTRRTSVMAGLINARAILTTTGKLTEPVWAETRSVALAPAGNIASLVDTAHALLADPAERNALAGRGEKTYRDRFALPHTIARLRGAVHGAAA
jgi:hypothetical protein